MQRRNLTFLIKVAVIALFVITIVGYSYSKSRNLIAGPQLRIDAPLNGSTAATSSLEIKGTATNITSIELNDRPIFIDESGAFKEITLLSSGYNALKLSAKDRFGRQTQKIIEILYKDNI